MTPAALARIGAANTGCAYCREVRSACEQLIQGERTARGVAEQHDAHASVSEGGDRLNGARIRPPSIVQTPVLIEQHTLQWSPTLGAHHFLHIMYSGLYAACNMY